MQRSLRETRKLNARQQTRETRVLLDRTTTEQAPWHTLSGNETL